jgi:hypothetical protein
MAQYDAQASSAGGTLSIRATLNASTEIPGSQAAATISGQSVVISKAFLLQASAGDIVRLQFAASSSGSGSVAPTGQGTIRPSVNLTIIQIK